MEMRVRATDPRPCPKCGKIYRSAHTLRTHLEDKHTVCPGYRCVLCGTVAKSRNSLHSHMSRQHRGISTKDLPVLPMPSAFDPELASRLLAKAGVKISAAELRARASPTNGGGGNGGSSSSSRRGTDGGGGGSIKHEYNQGGDNDSNIGDMDMMEDDPEDLTMGTGGGPNNNRYGHHGGVEASQHHLDMGGFSHPNTTITRVRHSSGAVTPKSMHLGGVMLDVEQQQKMERMQHQQQLPPTGATGSSILDTYLQFIQENTFGKSLRFNFSYFFFNFR